MNSSRPQHFEEDEDMCKQNVLFCTSEGVELAEENPIDRSAEKLVGGASNCQFHGLLSDSISEEDYCATLRKVLEEGKFEQHELFDRLSQLSRNGIPKELADDIHEILSFKIGATYLRA